MLLHQSAPALLLKPQPACHLHAAPPTTPAACLACLPPPACRSQGVQFVRCLVWEVVRMHHLGSYLVPRIKRHFPVGGRASVRGGAGRGHRGRASWNGGVALRFWWNKQSKRVASLILPSKLQMLLLC
jgi:hypothetical protein